jgi:small-conductance mechanosensitive channel
VVIAGIVPDIVGYNSLAFYWITSWGVSIVIGLWAGLFFKLLMEWRLQMKAAVLNTAQESSGSGQPFRWLILQIAWLVWFFALVFALILAWGGRQAVIVSVARSLNHPITIGKITFSVTNFVAAFFILLLTRSLVRFWRFVLREKILSESGLESGLQDSITTITVYAFWAFGILLSLHAFGLGTTSLALAFGALGIGLGFGLQNIFNNFISGIIMLFERPIQVGDDVEINGVWATVKKINVRATVVQTYDNASLIIPNSEFISSQVTNWSFKDKRLRRNIDVGVAYGSNIDRVRQTLLEIAQNTKNVFKTPQPDVIFKDFGDSALIFRLRVWTDIDNMLKVDTAIRFDIDRLFKERGIVIAFPQVDVHLHDGNEGSVMRNE